MTTDAELLARCDTDPHAFRELYDRNVDAVYSFFVRRCRSHEIAVDLTAETFSQAWQSRLHFVDRRGGAVAPWLFGIARNVLLRSVRQQRVADEARLSLGMGTLASHIIPDDRWLDDLDEDLALALAALPGTQRQAIELRILDDLDYHDIAEQLDCSPGAVRIRVSRGLGSLRSSLSNRVRLQGDNS
jgi:RNA polymerase sigma-70 factor (ECF subfamily)